MNAVIYRDAMGTMALDKTFRYNGTLKELSDIINKAIDHVGGDTKCSIAEFSNPCGSVRIRGAHIVVDVDAEVEYKDSNT